MKVINEKKICFIICSNDDRQLEECLLYINLLEVPRGYETEVLVITEAEAMTKAYNEAMNASDARYKVYLHQDVFIVEKKFISKIVNIFKKDKSIGMLGLIGSPKLPKDGVMWHGERCGWTYKGYESTIAPVKKGFQEVEAVDGYLMVTNQDIPWREDVFTGWDFYDISQCLEFRKLGYKIVVPAQKTEWAIHDCGPQKMWNYEMERQKLLKEYSSVFEMKKELRILFLHSTRIVLLGLPMALVELGHAVNIPEYKVTLEKYEEEDKIRLIEFLEEGNYDLVITIDFSAGVSEACEEEGIKYLAWVYDSPLMQLYIKEAKNECNHICVFDRKQKERLKEVGIKHLYYYPLATEVDNFGAAVISKADEKKYTSEISFVGNLYGWGEYERIFRNATVEICADADAVVNSTQCIWDGKNNVFGKANYETLQHIIEQQDESMWEEFSIDKIFYSECLILGIKASEIERIQILNRLAQKHEVVLYTGSQQTDVLKGVKIRPKVDYINVMPKIFHLSKINLNITSRTIESGLSQRIWDVLGVGGFLLTNYQPELEEYFEIGKELEVFHNLEELEEKVSFYLEHEEQRIRIAMNGYKKVRTFHKYSNRMETVLKEIIGYTG